MVIRTLGVGMLALLTLVAFVAVAQSKAANDSIAPLSIPPSASW